MNRSVVLVVVTLFLAVWLAGCGPNLAAEAEAEKIRSEAWQDARDREQVRELELEAARREAERQAALEPTVVKVQGWVLTFAGIAAVLAVLGIGVGMLILGAGSGAGLALGRVSKAMQIPLDPETRQFPLLVNYAGRGKFSVFNPNTNSVVLLDTAKEADRAMLILSGMTQYAGTLAQAASKKGADAGGVASITPPITLSGKDVHDA
jgi:Na+/H+ antiporter NhaC